MHNSFARLSRSVAVSLGLAVALPTTVGVARQNIHWLSSAECNFIETYDRENESHDFASDFAYMAHALDFEATGCRENCFSPLRKRTLDIDVFIMI